MRFLLLGLLVFAACDCGGEGLHARRAALIITPNPLIFDTVPRGTTAAASVRLENSGDLRLDVGRVALENGADAGFSLAATEPFSVEPGQSLDFEVRFTSAGELADVTGVLLFESNAHEQAETRVELRASRRQGPVLATCVESIDIPLPLRCGSPNAIDFSRVPIGEPRQALLSVRNEGTDPLSITALSFSGHPSIALVSPAVPATIEPGAKLSVPVEFTAAVTEQVEATIAIASNDPLLPNARVDLRGEGAEVGLCIEPPLLDFGEVRKGEQKELTLLLSNCGTAPIEVTSLEIFLGGAEFALLGSLALPITLPAQVGLTLQVRVNYAPIGEGADEGRLRISTSNGDRIVHLLGESNSCRLIAVPERLSFEWSPSIPSETKNFLLESAGPEPCTIERVEITRGAEEGFSFGRAAPRLLPGLPRVLQPSESIVVPVEFSRAQVETASITGAIEVQVAERPGDLLIIELASIIDTPGVCRLSASPASLSFGVLAPGGRRALGVRLSSGGVGEGPCILESISLIDSTGAFFVEPDPPQLVWGEGLLFVEFVPPGPGVYRGTVELLTRDQPPQTVQIALQGAAGAAEICVEPRELPFGERTTTATMSFTISACASASITVNALEWIAADAELALRAPPSLPLALAAGESREVIVEYRPVDQTGDTAVLAVRSSDPISPAIEVRVTGGRELVPPEEGRFLYYWQIDSADPAMPSDIVRLPLQGNLTAEPYWGGRAGQGCGGCHQLSPDGNYLAVGNIGVGGDGHVLIIDLATDAVADAPGSSFDSTFMSWNPDVATNPPYQYVYAMDNDLHLASLMTGYIGPVAGASDPQIYETMPSWGPNGQIVFVRADRPGGGGVGFSGSSSLQLIDEAGGSAIAVAGAGGNTFANYYPRFSPNGLWIAFTVSESAQGTISAPDAQIRLVSADNSGVVRELPAINTGGAASHPFWSAGGRFLSFASNRSGGLGSWDVYLAPIDPITGQDGAATNVMPANTPGFEHSAQWSP